MVSLLVKRYFGIMKFTEKMYLNCQIISVYFVRCLILLRNYKIVNYL
ncbi:hypothetical protein A1OE_679 [Candidatus Endolissoclinum faulkneri L2]|uniref:Uncharacterized protein n=1 Tax=Candidatus Endolissoclinum faulkneri L2 TaxID=1193729 RepID=K7YMY2_9PROT|nr:hypothetical protein A1OE_679 [Candidatus Endolissoclinum faulkneri L2]